MGGTQHTMKIVKSLAIFAILFAATSVYVFAEDAPPAGDADAMPEDEDMMSGDPETDGKKELEEMDTNKDGKASVDEVKAFMRSRYYSKEEDLKDLQNDDGKPATAEDITKMVERDAKELVEELDKDKSGDLNLEEVVAQYKDDGMDDMGDGDEEPMDDEEAGAGDEDAGEDK